LLRFSALGSVAQIPFRSAEPLGLPSAMSPCHEQFGLELTAERLGRTLGPNGAQDRRLTTKSFDSAQDKLCSPSMDTPLLQQLCLRGIVYFGKSGTLQGN